jgi:hypothetical protein
MKVVKAIREVLCFRDCRHNELYIVHTLAEL